MREPVRCYNQFKGEFGNQTFRNAEINLLVDLKLLNLPYNNIRSYLMLSFPWGKNQVSFLAGPY